MNIALVLIVSQGLYYFNALQLIPEVQTGMIIQSIAFAGTHHFTFTTGFSQPPEIVFQWYDLNVPGGPNSYSVVAQSITTEGFSYTCTSSTSIIRFSFYWMAILDDRLFVQSETVTQTISSEIVVLDFTFNNFVDYPATSLLISGISMSQTATSDSYAYWISVTSVVQNRFQLTVDMPTGYTITQFSFSVLYSSWQYIQTYQYSAFRNGSFYFLADNYLTKCYGVSFNGIVISGGVQIKITRPDSGYDFWLDMSTSTSVMSQILLTFFRYTPCPLYCANCVQCAYPNGTQFPCAPGEYPCSNCVESTYRTGLYCNQCVQTDVQQMFLVPGELNCRNCQTYCHYCDSNASNCLICSSITQRFGPPYCMNCPSQMYLEIGVDNCQECANYCNNCYGTSDTCTQCLPATLRLNPPDCKTCAPQHYLSNTENCLPCKSYCDGCTQISSFCIACNMNSFRADPPNCLNCILGYYFKEDACIQCNLACETCNEQGCLTCLTISQYVDSTKSCVNCPINCMTCDVSQCLSCISQDYILKDSKCQECPSNCIACDSKGGCHSGPENCQKGVLVNVQVQCINCFSHYYIQDGFCIKCANQCLECKISPQTCTSCRFSQIDLYQCQICESQPGYYSNYQSNTCYTICGDGIVQGNEECDDFNHVLNDGCSNCQVDVGHICTGIICSRIIYPIPKLYQIIPDILPYNPKKNMILQYNIPISSKNIDISLEIINDKNKIEFSYDLIYVNEYNYSIIITLQNQSINSTLSLKFVNPSNILTFDGIPQQIKEISVQISNYLVNTDFEQAISDTINTSVNYIFIILIILIVAAVIFGGLDIFWNLLDLLQAISYLKYINTEMPFYLFTFFDLFQILQFQNLPTNYLLNIQSYMKNLIDSSVFIKIPLIIQNDGFTSSTIINIIPFVNVLITSFAIYFAAKILFSVIRDFSYSASFESLKNHIKIVKFAYSVRNFTLIILDNIVKQWYWSGLIRIFTSSANDVSFMICLGLYGGLQVQQQNILIKFDSLLTLLTMIVYFSISFLISNIVGLGQQSLKLKEKQYGELFMRCSNQITKQNTIMLCWYAKSFYLWHLLFYYLMNQFIKQFVY